MYMPNQKLVGSATYSEMIEAASILKDKKGDTEETIRQALPKGFSVDIDNFGILHIMSPLCVHQKIL